MISTVATRDPIAAREEERPMLEQLQELLSGLPRMTLRLAGPTGDEVEMPGSAVHLLGQIVRTLARGDAVSVVPVHRELTTQQAADLLNVSRQYLVRLTDQGVIPHHKVGTHRRIKLDEVLAYRRQRDAARQNALDELDRMSQEMGLYT